MKLYGEISHLFVNKFAEYITQFDNKKIWIEVTDFHNFFVVKGISYDKNIIDLSEIKENFKKDYPSMFYGREHFNIFDLIDYNPKNLNDSHFNFTYYKSERPVYNQNSIDFFRDNSQWIKSVDYSEKVVVDCEEREKNRFDFNVDYELPSLSVKSNFPYGFSELYPYKIYLYYGEYIAYHLFKILLTEKIKIDFYVNHQENDTPKLDISVVCNSQYKDSDIKSMILDVFDLNINNFRAEKLVNYNFQHEIDNPLGEKPWLVYEKLKDMVIF